MTTTAIYGLPLTPAALADEKGNEVTVQSVHSAPWLERMLRLLCTEMGCSAGFASRPLTGGQLRQVSKHVCGSWRVVPVGMRSGWTGSYHIGTAESSQPACIPLLPSATSLALLGGHPSQALQPAPEELCSVSRT